MKAAYSFFVVIVQENIKIEVVGLSADEGLGR
jgi:hypothetical protein